MYLRFLFFLIATICVQAATLDLTNVGNIATVANTYGTTMYVSNPGANLKAQDQFTVTNGSAGWSKDSAGTEVPITSIPVVTYQGVKYFGIAMDVNEGSGVSADWDVIQFMVWAGSAGQSTDVAGISTKLANPFQTYDQLTSNAASGLSLIYQQNLNPQVGSGAVPYGGDPFRVVGLNSQSGSSGVDVAILIPISVLSGWNTDSKIYVGLQTGSLNSSGPEQVGFIDAATLTAGGWLATSAVVTASYFQANTTITASAGPVGYTTTSTTTYSNAGATTGTLNLVGTLSFTTGEGTVQVQNAAAQTSTLTFDALSRSPGATGNLTTPNVLTSKITFSAAPGVASRVVSPNLFMNGSGYAVNDAAGHMRPLNYATDSNTATVAGGATLGANGGKDIQLNGALTAQGSLSISTLKIAGDHNISLTPASVLATNGLLKSVGTGLGSSITGGAGAALQPATQDLVIRVDQSSDELTVDLPIIANSAWGLVKSGAGNLILNGNNTYAGNTYVNAGTLTVTGVSTATPQITVENTGTLAGTGTLGGSGTHTFAKPGGIISPGTSPTPLAVLTLGGDLSMAAGSALQLQVGGSGYLGPAVNVDGTLNTGYLGNGANRVGGTVDAVRLSGSLSLNSGANVSVSFQNYTPQLGDAFDLLDWTGAMTLNGFTFGGSTLRTGSVSENSLYDLDLPDLSNSGLRWDVSQFNTLGVIVVVPEPGRACLFALGMMFILARRRRCY